MDAFAVPAGLHPAVRRGGLAGGAAEQVADVAAGFDHRRTLQRTDTFMKRRVRRRRRQLLPWRRGGAVIASVERDSINAPSNLRFRSEV